METIVKESRISSDLAANKAYFDEKLQVGTNYDVLYRQIEIGGRQSLLYFIDGFCKDELMQKIAQNGTLLQQMAMYQQIALQLAAQIDPALAEQLAQGIMGGAQVQGSPGGGAQPFQGNDGGAGGSMTKLGNARAQAQQASQPGA